MRKPRVAQCFKRDEYWGEAERVRVQCGQLPEWAFDFISVHECAFYLEDKGHVYGLCSPMCIVEGNECGRRPAFEAVSFTTKAEAISAAKQIASARITRHLFVVDCC